MKIKLFLLLLPLLYLNANSQVGFRDHIIVNEIFGYEQPSTARTGDIDNDGDLDVVSSFLHNKKLVWYDNINGDGNHMEQKVIDADIEGVEAIFIADLDGDGDLDIAGVNDGESSYTDVVFWFENLDGLGEFSEQIIITSDVRKATDVYVADLDNDGDNDIISASSNKIAWYENTNGFGVFGEQQVVETPLNGFRDFLSLQVVDINSDDILDIVFIENGTLNWIEHLDGQGNFDNRKLIDSDSSDIASVYVEDFDGDSDNDIVFTHYREVIWKENLDGLGNFGPNNIITSSAIQVKSVYAGDLDGDNDLDIISVSKGNSTVEFYENIDGLGTFGAPNIVSDNTRFPKTVYLADINGDGRIDILTASIEDHKLQWFKNLDGVSDFGLPIIISKYTNSPLRLDISDFNSDGEGDILVTSYWDKKISWFPNHDSNFNIQHIVVNTRNPPNNNYAYTPVKALAADIDSDGDMDIIAGFSNAPINIVWYKNRDSKGDFGGEFIVSESPDNPSALSGLSDFYPVDIDSDGDIDVVSSVSGNNCRISLFKNMDGLGIFSNELIMFDPIGNNDTSAQIKSIHCNDIDGDNDMDILFTFDTSSGSGSGRVLWMENLDGLGGAFSAAKIIANKDVIDTPNQVYSSDLDNDGDIDVLSASSGDRKIAWYENLDGQGTFSSQRIIHSNSINASKVLSIDIDGDGDQDVVSNQEGITLFKNLDGLGSFSEGELISSITAPAAIKTGDMDGDGDIDLVTALPGYDTVAWHENFLEQQGNYISGNVTYGLNMIACQANNNPLRYLLITSEDSNGSSFYAAFTNNFGNYKITVPEGNFDTTASVQLPNYTISNPNTHVSNFSGIGNTDAIDFCVEPTDNLNDLSISLYPLGEPRPGFSTQYKLVYRNFGSTELSGSIELTFNEEKISFLNSSITVSSQSSNMINFDFSDLKPFEIRSIDLEFSVYPPPTADIDDILNFVATINPTLDDRTENDNEFVLKETIVGSYDPNDIRVLEGNQILLEDSEKYLHYLIRFQNTGTASAINVSVENVIDNRLDWSTMKLESLSHHGNVELNNGEIKFIFNNINLPDSTTDEPNSHGFIAYKIKPKEGVTVGEIIRNKADIFFDFNPAIVTNTVSTQIINVLSTEGNKISIFTISPNPTDGVLNVKSQKSTVTKLELYNNLGQVVFSVFNENQIDISSLISGIYFIKIEDGLGNTETKKIIKK